MSVVTKYLWIVVLGLSVAAFALGVMFIVQGVTKADWMEDAMRIEQVTLGLDETAVANGELVDSAGEAQAAGDVVREHRRGIASTYDELMGEGRFDPTNLDHLSYAQALNMENYLYLAVLGFGVTTVITGTGAFIVIMGIALGGTGVVLLRLTKRAS